MRLLKQWFARIPGDSDRERWAVGLLGASIVSVGALAASNILLGLAIVAAPWTIDRSRIPWARLRRPLTAFGLYILFFVASMAASREPATSWEELGLLFSLALFPMVLVSIRGERKLRFLVDALIVVGALYAADGLAQFFYGYGGLDRRIRGPFSHYMTFSGVLLTVDLLIVARLVANGDGGQARDEVPFLRRPVVSWVSLALVNLAILGSLTRNAWLALAITLVAVVAIRRPRWLLALPVAAGSFILLAPVPILGRVLSVASIADESNYDRLCMFLAGTEMVAERPLLGLGPDVVAMRYPLYRLPTAPRLRVPHLHNTYIQLAAESGLLTLFAYFAWMGLGLRAAWSAYRKDGARGGKTSDLLLGSTAAVFAFLIAGLFEYNWGDKEVQRLLLFAIAIPFCLDDGEPEGPAA